MPFGDIECESFISDPAILTVLKWRKRYWARFRR